MKLSEYYKLINRVDGVANPPDDPRITVKDLDFRGGKGKDGSATITFLDGEPVYLNWYIWDLDHAWMMEQVEAELGKMIKLTNHSGGNGHCGAEIEMQSSFERALLKLTGQAYAAGELHACWSDGGSCSNEQWCVSETDLKSAIQQFLKEFEVK